MKRLFPLFALLCLYLPNAYANTHAISLTVSGMINYTLPDGVNQARLHYAKIEVYDLNPNGVIKLGQGHLDINGAFSIPVTSTEAHGPDIYLAIYARDDYSVWVGSNNTDITTTHIAYTNVYYNTIDDLQIYSAVGSNIPNYLAWYIYDTIAYKAWHFLADNVGWDNNNNVAVAWTPTSPANPVTSGNRITLNGANGSEPDIFLHEYGHTVMFNVYAIGMPPDPNNPNCNAPQVAWGQNGTLVCAWTEGWFTFLEGAIQGHSRYAGTTRANSIPKQYDMEHPFPLAYGAGDPGAVAAFLWDIYDQSNETCDRMYTFINGANQNGQWKVFSQFQPTTVGAFYRLWVEQTTNGFNNELSLLANHHGVVGSAPPCQNEYTYIPMVQH